MAYLEAAVYGFIVGDALGVPYEFKERGSFLAKEMVGYGVHHQPKGTWSDDTSMMLATLHSIKECGRIDCVDMMERYCSWYFDGAYTACGEVFDVGGTCMRAMLRYRKDRNIDTCGGRDDYDNGNGALMRLLPLAFYSATEEQIDRVTALTHNHRISKEASRIYIRLIKGIVYGKNLERELGAMLLSKEFQQLKNLKPLREEDIKSGGYVVDTLTAALWCLLNTESYKDCVLRAVNLGDDTDTTAAVAGALAGLKYGYEAIPKKWLSNIKNRSLIEEILNQPMQFKSFDKSRPITLETIHERLGFDFIKAFSEHLIESMHCEDTGLSPDILLSEEEKAYIAESYRKERKP